jgi:predicted dinucleotide-binding enzyme
MRIAVLGTGMVGDTIASKLVKVGHRIKVGSIVSGEAPSAPTLTAKGDEGTSAPTVDKPLSGASARRARGIFAPQAQRDRLQDQAARPRPGRS